LNDLNLTHFKLWFDRLMMKSHLARFSNMNLHDLCSKLRRHLKKNKLSINRRYVDRRDSRKNCATLQQ
jgi:hypothetical protein